MRHIRRIRYIKNKRRIGVILLIFASLIIGIIRFVFLIPKNTEAAWSPNHSSWSKRKQLNVVNNSAGNLSANTTIAITVDTKSLYNSGYLQSDCDDLRILYQPSTNQATDLTRHLVYPSGTTCSTSTATKAYFPIQATLNAAASSTAYYMYYSNISASSPSNTDNAFDIGSADALLVCPFDGSTTCAAGETPSTETGAIRYSGSKSALSFDGISDYVTVSNHSSIQLSLPYTVEIWARSKNTSISACLFSKDTYPFNYTLCANDAGGELRFASGGNGYNMSTDIWDGEWHHIAVTVNQSGILQYYIDGVAKESYSGVTTSTGNDNLSIGSGGGTDNPFQGQLDELRISNTVRYTGNFTPQTTHFVRDEYTKLLLHFDENGDDPRNTGKANDDSGNGNHGTITGAKYVAGLVGVDASTSNTGYLSDQSYSSHEGVFIEKATTNKITNPSFEHATYDTNWDAVGANLTASENTTAPYYKFGSKSLKLIASDSAISGTSNMDTIGIDPNSTTTHTFSFYAYDGTSGNVGGTITSSIVKPVWEGVAQAGATYTDIGGGWWQVRYSATTTDSANEYGVEAQVSKTVYIDGIQLEVNAYNTTYTDGSLTSDSGGADTYFWDDDCDGTKDTGEDEAADQNTQCSSRITTQVTYSNAFSSSDSTGAISLWVKPNWNGNKAPSTQYGRIAYVKIGAGGWGWGNGFLIRSYCGDSGCTTANNFGVESFGSGLGGVSISTTVTINNWYHIVFSWNGTNGYLYVNNSSNSSAFTATTDNGSVYLGSTSYAIVPDSNISDLRLFDSHISSTDAANLYYAGLVSHSDSQSVDRFGGTDEDPVAIYHMDEGTGSTVSDSSINANNLTTYGATWEVGSESNRSALSRSLKFDGTNDSASSSAKLNGMNFGSGSFSVSTWFRHSSTIADTDTLLSQYSTAGYKVYMNSSGYICAGIDDDSTWGPDDSVCTTTSYADSKWHHAELVKNGTTDLSLYIDGIRAGYDNSISATGSLSTGSPLFIGADTNSSNYWDGYLDEMYFYSYARSADQVKQDYLQYQTAVTFGTQSGDPVPNGLIAYWKMDETSGSRNDSSGNGWTLSDNNTVTSTTGKVGNTALFTAANNEKLSLASPLTIADNTPWTVSFWFQKTAAIPTYIRFISNPSNTSRIDGVIYRNSNDMVQIRSVTDSSSAGWPLGGSGFVNNSWYHIVFTCDSNRNVSTYYNNVYKGTNTFTTSSALNFKDFGFNSWWGQYFDGLMDEIKIYNRALSSTEITALYNYSPSAHWKMDEGSGTTTADSSGNNNNSLTFTGEVSWSLGKFGNSLNFEGTDDVVSITESTSIDLGTPTDSYTIEAWFKTSANYSSNAYIVAKDDSTSTPYPYLLYLNSSEYGCFQIGENTNTPSACGSTALNNGVWHHITGVRNITTDKIYVYVDGVQITNTTDSTTATTVNDDNISIGNGGTSYTGQDFNGQIDDVRIYNYARTPAQIVEDMNAGHPAPGSPIGSAIAEWRFDEAYGTTANDAISNNNLSLVNSSFTLNGKIQGAVIVGSQDTNAPLSLTDDADFDFAGGESFTLSLWIKTESGSNPSFPLGILGKGDAGANPDTQGYGIWFEDTGKITFGIDDDTEFTPPDDFVTTANDYYDNAWHHITAVKEASTELRLYLDGMLVGTDASISATGTLANSLDLEIGRSPHSKITTGVTFDQISIFRSALNSDQVKILFNQGKSQVLGSLATETTGISANSTSRSFCPPGDTTASCAPVAEWKLDENSGAYAYDTSANSNRADITGAAWSIGKTGAGLNFSAQSNYLDAGSGTTIDDIWDGGGTLSFWLYPRSTGLGGNAVIFYKTASNLGWTLESGGVSGNNLKIGIYKHFSGTDGYWTTDYIFPLNTWSHLSVTYNADNVANNAQFYRNGIPVTTTQTLGPPTNTRNSEASGNLIIGRNALSTKNFDGFMDQIRLYTYSLSPAQIAWDYNKGAPQVWFKTDECSSSTLNNSAPAASGGDSDNDVTLYPVTNGNDAVGSCSSGDTTEMWNNGTTGKFNSSVDFDGSDDYAATGNTAIMTASTLTYTNASWGGWFKPSTDTATDTLIMKGDGNTTNEFKLTTDANGKPVCSIYYSSAWHTIATGLNALTTSSWSHVLCTYDGATGRIYVNGIQTGYLAETNSITSSSSSPLTLASDPNNGSRTGFFDGQIDEVKIWSYALTSQQVKTEYNNGSAVKF